MAEPEKFDLLELQNIEEVLGSSPMAAGRYQQIRFDITEVVLTIFGNVRMAEAPRSWFLPESLTWRQARRRC